MRRHLVGGPAVAAGLALLIAASLASAHDFWLVPNAFRIVAGQEVSVLGRTSSSFPASESAVTVDRVGDARVLLADRDEEVSNLDVLDTSLRLRFRPERPGQHVVAVRIEPRLVPESADSFRRYLRLEGAPEALERYEAEGILPTDSIIRRYAKYAKTFVEVGADGPRAYARRAGHPLEFIPLDDPSRLRPGRSVRFELRLHGQLLADTPVHAGVAPGLAAAGPSVDRTLRTDPHGQVVVSVDDAGMWNVRGLVIVPADPGSGADWDVHWATVVFSVDAALPIPPEPNA